MPESKPPRKKKATYEATTTAAAPKGNPRWLVPVMLGLMILGLLWIVTTYITAPAYWPVPPLGQWNLAVGFVLLFAGFGLTTRWR